MLSHLFGSEARVKVLSLLLTHPDQDFYGREIGRLADLLPRAVHRELERLTGFGIIQREVRGNRVYVKANRDHPIFPELRAIFIKTVALADPIREELAKRTGIELAFIYGSVAANADTAESDIDLFVVGDTSLSRLTPVLSRLEHLLAREINASIFAPPEIASRHAQEDSFIEAILAEPKIFLIGTAETFAEMLT